MKRLLIILFWGFLIGAVAKCAGAIFEGGEWPAFGMAIGFMLSIILDQKEQLKRHSS